MSRHRSGMRPGDVLAALVVVAVWGVAFVGIKKALVAGPPLTMAGARFVLAGLMLVPFAARSRRVGRIPTLREALVVGLLQTSVLYGFAFLGVQRTTAGASALLLATTPALVALLAVPLLGEPVRVRSACGIGLAFAGVAVVTFRSGLGSPAGVGLLLVGAAGWAAATIVVKRLGAVDHLRLSCGQLLCGGLPLLAAGVSFEQELPILTLEAAIWFGFLVIPATAVNFVIWFRLLERHPAGSMTAWLFLVPCFAAAGGAVWLDEPLGWRLAAGGLLIVGGLTLVQTSARSARRAAVGPG